MNIVYNASAGTGKTYQVVKLYEQLVLEQGINPCKILLMTFTDNAAAELRMGVSNRLLQVRRRAEADSNGVLAEQAITAMAHLPSAPIGTIHAYCTRLLREHALEAGLSPGFSVLTGDARDELLDQITRNELLARLETDADFRSFCSGAHIIGSGEGFGSSITETTPNLISQADSLGISLEKAEAMLPLPTSATTRIEFELICQRIQALPKITAAVNSALALIQQGLQETRDAEALVAWLNEMGIKKFGRGGAKEISDDFWTLKETVEEGVKYRARFPAAKAFARYVQAVAEQFQRRKHAMDVVDFADQLKMARELLQKEQVKPEFDYVIVDEVQDTSRVQYDLIHALWGETTNLIICGDKKQSIYTWRGADPQVMPDLEKAILAANGILENLQTSYRSKEPILNVVNTLFTSIYGEEEYSETETLQSNFETNDEKPCVEFLSPVEEMTEWPMRDKVAVAMEAIANRINLLVSGSSDWQPNFRYSGSFQSTDPSNQYRYSDVLILLRRTTHQSALEQALRHAGIPYTLGGKGRGLFTRQETRDVSLFLNILTNPMDAYSLIGFLRSPWVGLSDETIAELAWSEEGFSIENLMKNYSKQTDIIDRYREWFGTKLASELVRMVIDETGYDALLAGLPRGVQRLANLRKVLDWLREHERGAQTTPAAVARKLSEQIKNPPPVPEAALLDPAQNAVTLMTVHGSKGLTQRVVVLPDISFGSKANTRFAQVFFDENQKPTLGLRITAPDKSKAESPGFQAANARARDVQDHELKNLFYVAMTRARDLVITSASSGKKTAGWLKHMEPLIGQEIPALPYSSLAEAATIPQTVNRKLPTPNLLSAALETLPMPPEQPMLRRIPATQLAKELAGERMTGSAPKTTTSSIGSLGHAVLEQLALNGWNGDVGAWLERLRDRFGIGKTEAAALKKRIGLARELMQKTTSGMQEICAEVPFVLHDGGRLIDGTIDLLCRADHGFALFDYKFTEADNNAVTEAYRGQMEIYGKAARWIFPEAEVQDMALIVVSTKAARLVVI